MAEILLEADHVGLAYHELDGETLAVEDISFAVEKGEFLSIVGPSGCGKTSILSMIDGLMQPSRGRINLYGKSCWNRKRGGTVGSSSGSEAE